VSSFVRGRRIAGASLVAALVAVLVGTAAITTQAAADGKGFMWRVERDGQIGWLVGSIHVLSPEYYPLPATMQKAFLRSTTLLEEADLREMASPEVLDLMRTKAIYAGGETLKTSVSPETYQLAADRAAKIGLPMEAVDRMRPWLMTLTLVAAEMKAAGFDPALGVDRHFFEKSERMGKKFRTLESMAEQLEIFAGFSPQLQEAMLRDTLKSLDDEIGRMQTVAKAWHGGDAETIERLVLGSIMKDQSLYDAVIVKRNRNWVPKIEACLNEGHCFVVVGAAHLVGPDGLIATLKQKGYSVVQE
jgi:uncharacterized protein YbaP (TraB family)